MPTYAANFNMATGHQAKAYWNDSAQSVLGQGGFGTVRIAVVQCSRDPKFAHVRALKLPRNDAAKQDLHQEYVAGCKIRTLNTNATGVAPSDCLIRVKGENRDMGAYLMEALPKRCTEYSMTDQNPRFNALSAPLKYAIRLGDFHDRIASLPYMVEKKINIDRTDDNDENRAYGFSGEFKRIDLMPRRNRPSATADLHDLSRRTLNQFKAAFPAKTNDIQRYSNALSNINPTDKDSLIQLLQALYNDGSLWTGAASAAHRKSLLAIPAKLNTVHFDESNPAAALQAAINAYPSGR